MAALQFQSDAGFMISNLQVLDQFVTSLNRMSLELLRLAFGPEVFPSAVMDNLSLVPRAPRAAHYMSAMGLWRPPGGPGDPGPLPVSSCNSWTVGIYIQYIYICIKQIVVLASEPVGGRSRATELPCFSYHAL